MKFRWPIRKSECDECGHVSFYWVKPWYTPRPVGFASVMHNMITYESVPVFSKDAMIIIPHFKSVTAVPKDGATVEDIFSGG